MRFRIAIFLLVTSVAFSQNYESRWMGHFSYNAIKDISTSSHKLYAAAENAVFVYDLELDETSTISTIQGLTGDFITSLHYSSGYELLIIGYENGMIDVYNEPEKKVLKVVDIFDKMTIPPDKKRINHFNEHQEKLYISTKYGISVYDLNRLEFGDTYYIGDFGTQINIVQTTILDSSIYAATENNGIRKANIESGDLIDYHNWSTIVPGSFKGIETLGSELYAATGNNAILRVAPDGSTSQVHQFSEQIKQIQLSEELLTITTAQSIQVYSSGFNHTTTISQLVDYNLNLNSGSVFNNRVLLGTNDHGLLMVPIGTTAVTQILPDGPIRNRPFGLDATPGQLWVVFGETDIDYNPYVPSLTKYGVSHLKDSVWNNISYDELRNSVNGEPTSLLKATINPKNPGEVYMSSYQNGLLKIVDNEPVVLYNETNSPLTKEGNAGIRLFGSEFDREGNLWIVQSRTDKGLIRISPEGQFRKVDLSNSFDIRSEIALTKLTISREGYVFFGGYYNGVLGYNPQTQSIGKIGQHAGSGNLPSANVRALAMDAQNRLWIGTLRGLRVLYNPSSIFESGTRDAQAIIILENNVPQELLYQQSITAIKVDGSNNKWISTASSGVFYLSPNGQETLLRFTKDNSPLPTNNVQDIAIDQESGVVYFATTQGLVAYHGNATAPKDNLDFLRAYPNPVRPNFNGNVTIDGLTAQANVKITDITGNLVYETVSQGGSIQWDTTAFGKYRVKSGVYLIMVTTDDSSETKVAKVMIIR